MNSVSFLAALLLAVCGLGCKSANVTSEQHFGGAVSRPSCVYIADFELGVQEIKHEEGPLSSRPGPVGRIGQRLSGASPDPAARARQLVDLMSDSLVKDLSNSGLKSTRLRPGTPIPHEGWLVRGVFVEVQEGNKVRRAVIGFGHGQTDLQVIAAVDDLAHGPPRPLYQVATDATSGHTPGAAPFILLSPYGAAARFVLAGHDLDKNVEQTALQIAERLSKRAQVLD